MTLVQSLRAAGGQYAKPNIYDDAADRINALETALRVRGHSDVCVTRVRGNFPCDCGLGAVLQETQPEFDPAWVCGVCGKRHGRGACLGLETFGERCLKDADALLAKKVDAPQETKGEQNGG